MLKLFVENQILRDTYNMTTFQCSVCKSNYPETGLPHHCPVCGGVFEVTELTFSRKVNSLYPGLWQYRHCFGIPIEYPVTYLGEGDTPLVSRKIHSKQVSFKLEYLNPTGSFKDRGTAVLTSFLIGRGIDRVVEDSSGNAGASLAFYSAANGIKSSIFVPSSTSGPKRRQMEACGGNVIPIPGGRENAHHAALALVEEQSIPYASHALLPFGIPGIATIAFEIFEQLGGLPGTIVAPVGHGSLFAGLALGIEALRVQFGFSEAVSLVGVQPERCAPLVARWKGKKFEYLGQASIAEGTQIVAPVREAQALRFLKPGLDDMISIEEEQILPAASDLARIGFYVEPTSALVWAAFSRHCQDWKEPIVLILTGSGLKFGE